MFERLQALQMRYESLTRDLMDPVVLGQSSLFQERARQQSELEEVVRLFREFQGVDEHLRQALELERDEKDPELRAMASEERQILEGRRLRLEHDLRMALLPKDPNDGRNVYVEVRAGTGGDEASLFAGELLRMYTRHAENQRWVPELMSMSPSEVGGIKEAILLVKGKGAHGLLKYEAGVHRVQRVPATEANGRIHTSTATVVVMPETEEHEVQINDKDLKWDFFNSSGAGGQSVNTTYSAVRLTHMPSGLVVSMQDERSQLKNKAKALRVMGARLKAQESDRREMEQSAARKAQVSSGDRSEKIRTYNFPQNRVTDHRVGVSSYDLPRVMNGDLAVFIKALQEQEQRDKLAELAPV